MITKHIDKIGIRYICDCQPDLNNQDLDYDSYERIVRCNRCKSTIPIDDNDIV